MKKFGLSILVLFSILFMMPNADASQSGIVGRAKGFIPRVSLPQVKLPDWPVVERAQRIVDALPAVNVDPRLAQAAQSFQQAIIRFKNCVMRHGTCSTAHKRVIAAAITVTTYFAVVGGLSVREINRLKKEIKEVENRIRQTGKLQVLISFGPENEEKIAENHIKDINSLRSYPERLAQMKQLESLLERYVFQTPDKDE